MDQELIIDYSELSIPNNFKTLYKTVPNDNYNTNYKLLSKNIIKYLKDVNIFLVGSGALGCEYLKLFHMLNISSNKLSDTKGKITVTDMDTIELSNFLSTKRESAFLKYSEAKIVSFTLCASI